VSTPEPRVQAGKRRLPLGTVVMGLLLVLAGVLWLLESLDLADIPWDAVLPAALVVVGAALIIASRTERHGGLIAVGIVLTVLTAASSAIDVPLRGGIGDRVERPVSIESLEEDYDLAIGRLEVDLSAIELPAGTTTLEIGVGMGELVVQVPEDVVLDVTAEVGVGDATLLDVEEDGGAGVDVRYTDQDFGSASTRLSLALTVGLGDVNVTR
jgi:hypothetical protein